MTDSNLDKRIWHPSPVLIEGRRVDASHHICPSYADCIALHADNWRQLAEAGGMLIIKIQEAQLVEERIPGVDMVFKKYDGPPIVQLWRFPRLDLSTAVKLANEWGFPDSACSSANRSVRDEIKDVLLALNSRYSLCMERISPDFIILRQLSGPRIEMSTLEGIMKANLRLFGITLSDAEQMDQMRHWHKKGFFTIGAI